MVISSVGDLGFCEFYSFLSISYKCVNWYLELQFTIFIKMLNFCAAAYVLKCIQKVLNCKTLSRQNTMIIVCIY